MILPVSSASIPLVSANFGLRIDRGGITLAGAASMLGCNALTMSDAAKAADDKAIVHFGMMAVVPHLRKAGLFALATTRNPIGPPIPRPSRR